MDIETIKVFGQVAGMGGLSLGVFFYLFKEVIRKQIFPQLTKQQAYNIIRLILVLNSIVVLAGIGAWLYAIQIEKSKQHPDYATSLNYLASLYKAQGDYEKALPLYQQALQIKEQVNVGCIINAPLRKRWISWCVTTHPT